MDINKKAIDNILSVLTHPAVMYPAMWLFGFTSRVAWDYFNNQKLPQFRKLVALLIMAGFATVLTVLILTSFDVNDRVLRWAIPMSSFFGHNLLTFLMENQSEIMGAIKNKIKKKLS